MDSASKNLQRLAAPGHCFKSSSNTAVNNSIRNSHISMRCQLLPLLPPALPGCP
jgi:hypothetical protein